MFRLKSKRTELKPRIFVMRLPYMTEQGLNFRRQPIAMHTKDWKPTAAASR